MSKNYSSPVTIKFTKSKGHFALSLKQKQSNIQQIDIVEVSCLKYEVISFVLEFRLIHSLLT
jgi:hypothetical protein